MTENGLTFIVLALIGFAGMIYIPMVWLLVRTLNTLTRVSGGSHRESDRERRDMHDMLLKSLENQSVGPTLAMQQHGMERLERMRMETSLQRDELRSERPVPGGQAPSGGETTDDVTLALE